jgi:cytoskeletal protein RodZ
MKEDESILGLASIRRNRGVSLEQIAESTKLSVRFLEAIEHGDFRKLPGGIYNTNYIRQYARAIDYDEAALLAFYRRQTSPAAGASAANGKQTVGGLRTASTFSRS